MRRKIAIFMTFVMCFMLYSNTTTTKAAAETSTITVNGVQRTLTYENKCLYIQIGEEEKSLLTYGDISYGFDRYGCVWKLVKGENMPMWWSYELIYPHTFFQSIITPEGVEINDAESFVFEYSGDQKFVVGYNTLSGGICPLPTFEEMREEVSSPDVQIPTVSPEPPNVVIPTSTPTPSTSPTPTPTPTPSTSTTPTPTPSKATPEVPTTPSVIQTESPKKTPVITAKPTADPKTSNKVSLEKKGSYTCLSVGGKVVSKYKLKKGVLTWKGAKKSKKYKKVKQVAFIKKSKNLIYVTKKGKVGTISPTGKSKVILKKGGKKLILKGKYAKKVKKTSGKVINVTKK